MGTEDFTAMSTMPRTTPTDYGAGFGHFPVDVTGRVDLTIHRRTDTHHGATLQLLGHAAEYLVESHRFDLRADTKANDEAIHMRLSGEIFDQYAEGAALRRRFHDWVMD